MLQRVNNNDYVVSTRTGARELLYLTSKKHEDFSVFEQCRRVIGITPTDRNYRTNYRSARRMLCNELFHISMEALKPLGFVSTFDTTQTTIVRVQFRPQHVIKWAAYRFEDMIYFAPRTVALASMSDILLKPPAQKRRNIKTAAPAEILVTETNSTNFGG